MFIIMCAPRMWHGLLQTAFLEVVIPPDIVYEETSGDMMVPEGGSAKLVCKARGYPKPRIVWRREDGGPIVTRGNPLTKVERFTSVEGEILMLTKVTRSEMGAYLCIAANGVPPSVSKRMMLHVHCKYYLFFTCYICSWGFNCFKIKLVELILNYLCQ